MVFVNLKIKKNSEINIFVSNPKIMQLPVQVLADWLLIIKDRKLSLVNRPPIIFSHSQISKNLQSKYCPK